MNRKEQILDAAADHRDYVCCGFIDPVADMREESFAEGARWADKTMIDKACEWLDKNITNYKSDMMGYIEYSQISDIIRDFRKAMEK